MSVIDICALVERVANPANRLTTSSAISQLAALASPSPINTELMAAAMLACDRWGDSQHARGEMRAQVLQTPTHLKGDLLDHFRAVYAVSSCDLLHPIKPRDGHPSIRPSMENQCQKLE